MNLAQALRDGLERLQEAPGGFEFVEVGGVSDFSRLADFIQLEVAESADLTLFGQLSEIPSRVQRLLQTATNLDQATCLDLGTRLQELTAAMIQATGQESALVMVRTFRPQAKPSGRRWHYDGTFSGAPREVKLVWTPAGRTTLVATPDREQRELFDQLFSQVGPHSEGELVSQIDALLKNCQPEAAASNDLATLFHVGPAQPTCIHSEPDLDQPRIFTSIVGIPASQLGPLRQRFELKPLQRLAQRIAEGARPSFPAHQVALELAWEFWGNEFDPQLQLLQQSEAPGWSQWARQLKSQP